VTVNGSEGLVFEPVLLPLLLDIIEIVATLVIVHSPIHLF
jgi:hypothetical protein